MMSMRQWRHERNIMPDVNGETLVRDRLTFELRAMLRPLTPVFAAGIGVLFAHRHRRLQRHFVNE